MIDNRSLCLDWISEFPRLTQFKGGRKIIRRSGPVIYGLELEKYTSRDYRPKFIALNLLSSHPGFCISSMLRSSKGKGVYLEYSNHSIKYHEMANSIKLNFPLLAENSEGNIKATIIESFQLEVERSINDYSSPLAIWFSLIQLCIYYGLVDLLENEKVKMLEYSRGLPSESPAIFGDFDEFIENELNVTFETLESRKVVNILKGGWNI